MSALDQLAAVNDRWTRAEVLRAMIAAPSREDLDTIQKAINRLTGGDFTPYRKKIDPLDPDTACQGILFSARAGVFKTDPYAVQAFIPFVGGSGDFLSRQLRSMPDGERFYAVYQLLEAQLVILNSIER